MKRRAVFSLLFSACAIMLHTPDSFAGDRNIVRFGEPVHVSDGETIENAISIFGSVTVDGVVDEAAVSILGDVNLGPKAVVYGDIVALGGSINRVFGSATHGSETSIGMDLSDMEKILLLSMPVVTSIAASAFALAALFSGIGFFALVVLTLLLFEPAVRRTEQAARARPGFCLLLGFAILAASVPILLFLVFTLIGIPLAFLGAAAALAAAILGFVGVSLWIGEALCEKLRWKWPPLPAGMLGTGLLLVLGFIPIIGTILQILAVLVGLGAVLQIRQKA